MFCEGEGAVVLEVVMVLGVGPGGEGRDGVVGDVYIDRRLGEISSDCNVLSAALGIARDRGKAAGLGGGGSILEGGTRAGWDDGRHNLLPAKSSCCHILQAHPSAEFSQSSTIFLML